MVPEERRDPEKPIVYVVTASTELEQRLISIQAGQTPPVTGQESAAKVSAVGAVASDINANLDDKRGARSNCYRS